MNTSVLAAPVNAWLHHSVCVCVCVCVCRTLHLDHGVCELRHTEDLPAEPQVPPEHWSWAAEPLHHRLLPHCSGDATPQIQNGRHKGIHAFIHAEILKPWLVPADCALRPGPEEHHGEQVSLGGEDSRVQPGPRHEPHEPPQQPVEEPAGRNTLTHTHTRLNWSTTLWKPVFWFRPAPFVGPI